MTAKTSQEIKKWLREVENDVGKSYGRECKRWFPAENYNNLKKAASFNARMCKMKHIDKEEVKAILKVCKRALESYGDLKMHRNEKNAKQFFDEKLVEGALKEIEQAEEKLGLKDVTEPKSKCCNAKISRCDGTGELYCERCGENPNGVAK